jgi:hypothetical protein
VGDTEEITTPGGTLQMLAEVHPEHAANTTVVWSISSGGTHATINAQTGQLTAVSNGTVTVRATATDGSGVFGEITIHISGQPSSGGGTGGGGTGGGSGGGGGTGGSPALPGETPNPDDDSQPDAIDVEIDSTVVVNDGEASIEITAEALSDAIEAILEDDGDVELVINIDYDEAGVDAIRLSLPADAFQTLAIDTDAALTIASPLVSITFDSDALTTIGEAGKDAVTITAKRTEDIDIADEYKDIVGSRPVFEFAVKNGNKTVSEFGGNATVVIPYELGKDENPNAIVVYYIGSDGKLSVCNAKYDAGKKAVVLVTTHFSAYAVGYNLVTFIDVPRTHPNYDAVTYIAARGITNGVGGGRYGIDNRVTRLQMLVLVMKMTGYTDEDANAYDGTDNFADAKNDWAYGWLGVARRDGIVSGDGTNYNGKRVLQQQEMLFLFARTLVDIGGKLPTARDGFKLEDIVEDGGFSSWIRDDNRFSVIEAILLSGIFGEHVKPRESCDRGLMTQLLYNLDLFAK